MPDLLEDHEDDDNLVRQLRKALRESKKGQTEAEARAAAAEGKLTETNLKGILTAKGVNPKAAKFIVAEGVDATDEKAVAEWLEENADVFPATATEAPPQQDEQQTEEPGQEPLTETVQDFEKLGGISAMQRPIDRTRFDEINRTLPDNATPEEVAAAFKRG